jgi:hypothetical protein
MPHSETAHLQPVRTVSEYNACNAKNWKLKL